MREVFCLVCAVMLALPLFVGCTSQPPTTETTTPTVSSTPPVAESYEYTIKNGYYYFPSLVDNWIEADALTTTTEDGIFFCMTDDTQQADDFVVSQRTLLRFLREKGMEAGNLEYFATNYNDSFSKSSDQEAYIALSAVRTQQQVLVTLQSLWGDYTDYGYVWAMSNTIAKELGWKTDPVPTVQNSDMDAFFRDAPEAINLLYPTFTTTYASEETVSCCKALADSLFEKTGWHAALAKPIEAQLADWHALIDAYAQEIGISFTKQTLGYAYFGDNVPLRIMTTYAELLIDRDYKDQFSSMYGDYFTTYDKIYQTANLINDEITAAVDFLDCGIEIGVMRMKWVDYTDLDAQKYLNKHAGVYYSASETAYVSSIRSYLHEFIHHMEWSVHPEASNTWQWEALCQLGSSYSQYVLTPVESTFVRNEAGVELFFACTGRAYQPGRADYFEGMDILCLINNYHEDSYQFTKSAPGAPLASFSYYLVNLYGEETACQILLTPNLVGEVTGKTWSALITEWKLYIHNKYAGVEIPDSLK